MPKKGWLTEIKEDCALLKLVAVFEYQREEDEEQHENDKGYFERSQNDPEKEVFSHFVLGELKGEQLVGFQVKSGTFDPWFVQTMKN